MQRTPVKSSNIFSIGYDIQTSILEIEFNNGQIYQYYNVPQSTHVAIMKAKSHGEYFAEYIKENYKFRRIS